MSKIKITNHQLLSLTACATCGSSVIVVGSPVAALCQRDGWIASLLSSVLGILFILLYYHLGQLFPNKNLVQILFSIFGKWIGGVITAYFIIFCLHSGIQITAYIGQFMSTEYLITTPVSVINFMIIFLFGIALHYGIETTVRSAEILFRLVVLIMAFLFLANIGNIQFNYIVPVMENGFYPVLKGTLYITSFRVWPLVLLTMIYPIHTENNSATLKYYFYGYLFGCIIMFFIMIMTILVLGSHVTYISVYSTYFLAKQINLGFLSRVEGLIVGAWIITLFYKGFCYIYAGVQGLAYSLHLKDYRKIIAPILFSTLIYSNIVYPNSAYLGFWDKYVWVPYSFTTGALIPIAIIIVYYIRKNFFSADNTNTVQNVPDYSG
ncbi:MAG: endospore germination permease [Clostridium sp.]|uniref:GerAB/ArcD/ProY family transporter n=1 Tax=Clostridium sp. TaxID=1506 RepID=UPI00290B3747|nr:endospore germination permease [Clostridium sp.]MDU7338500.1 endospore germination permease [Clostridium sp.]